MSLKSYSKLTDEELLDELRELEESILVDVHANDAILERERIIQEQAVRYSFKTGY